ncbi:cation diffusion facilitator family transporter [Adhaeribacter radiodurans]|uniref:Cation diffusion facilitator family transporter n=1 Tax=Adhaeribacter radiodurans TaxID=2745197 RepID=A0A7L7LB30_9BACT|nr:cation diffusion facilitator family transporter [Adhaeribacter radiodurans]QMU29924.1 cation diffusion facilitator family transporter [Adhaeribacter radiodurans]
MKPIEKFEFPAELVPLFQKAKRLEWLTLVYLAITIVVMVATMGNSQAMKTAWFEDMLSMTPSIAFLISARIIAKPANKEFPYGYHKAVSIAYLCSSLALFTVGSFLVIDSSLTLIEGDRPTIGTVVIFGHQIWLGYLMMIALVWGSVPAVFLGKAKLPLAKKLHSKNLYTDAEMQKADWMTGFAAILGITGIGMGWWWADAAAAAIISLDIIHDGYKNLKQSLFDLIDQVPKTVDNQKTDPIINHIEDFLKQKPWVKEAEIRLREDGHIYFGEAFVVPVSPDNLTAYVEATSKEIENMHWHLHEFIITLVSNLPQPEEK